MILFYLLRRFVLKYAVPEVWWPNHVQLDGVEFKVRNTPYSFGIKYLLKKAPETYEASERAFLAYIRKGDYVLELGSSIGILTRLIGEKVGDKGRVLAIEASRKLTNYSKLWLERQGNIEVINKYAFPIFNAIPISGSFNDDYGSLGGKVEFENASSMLPYEKCFFLEEAERVYTFQANVLVCDIEGSEAIMLKHDPNIPAYFKTIIIELHPSIYSMLTTLNIIDTIKGQGFSLEASLHSVYLFRR